MKGISEFIAWCHIYVFVLTSTLISVPLGISNQIIVKKNNKEGTWGSFLSSDTILLEGWFGYLALVETSFRTNLHKFMQVVEMAGCRLTARNKSFFTLPLSLHHDQHHCQDYHHFPIEIGFSMEHNFTLWSLHRNW